MDFDPLRVAEWVSHQVALEQITDSLTAAEVERHCLALARRGLPECYRFAERAQLFWRGITRGNRNTTAGLDTPDAHVKDFILKVCDSHYHPVLRQFLVDNGVMLDSPFPVTPEEVAFTLAGGSLQSSEDESHWRLRHLYDGKHAFEGRAHTLNSYEDGDHFTESAGLVAVRSACDDNLGQYGCVAKTLRWCAFENFGYDPDRYFDPGGTINSVSHAVPVERQSFCENHPSSSWQYPDFAPHWAGQNHKEKI